MLRWSTISFHPIPGAAACGLAAGLFPVAPLAPAIPDLLSVEKNRLDTLLFLEFWVNLSRLGGTWSVLGQPSKKIFSNG